MGGGCTTWPRIRRKGLARDGDSRAPTGQGPATTATPGLRSAPGSVLPARPHSNTGDIAVTLPTGTTRCSPPGAATVIANGQISD
jgi:hypothetical protein